MISLTQKKLMIFKNIGDTFFLADIFGDQEFYVFKKIRLVDIQFQN